MTAIGSVILVGAGPGDPDLLTVRGARAIATAQVLVHDALVDARTLALAPRACERIDVGKRKCGAQRPQGEIDALLVAKARAGLRVVRLKGGDPFIFGRGGEELDALDRAGVPWSVVPGITAASGAAASVGLPLTHRGANRAFTCVTAHRDHGRLEVDWPLVLRPGQTVVFYMAATLIDELVRELSLRGMAPTTPFTVVARASLADQFVVHGVLGDILERLAGAEIPRPALLILGARRDAPSCLSAVLGDRDAA